MDLVERQRDDGVLLLALNRPERRNALSGALVEALRDALAEANRDDEVRAVVITGRGKAFCAGGDLADGMAAASQGFLANHDARAGFARLLEEIPGCRVPVIAAVTGDALGGGCGLVAACDLAVADPEARLGTPEIKLGLFPWIILAALQRSVPRKALLEMVLTGEKIDARHARSIGLVNRISAPGAALEEAVELARVLAARSPVALQRGKAAFHRVADMSYGDALDYMHSQLSLNLLTEDAMEGVAAFFQKRDPTWKGR